MICKICGKEIENKFYLHVNGHRLKNKEYFVRFPEQIEEFKKQRTPQWNKGQTKENNSTIKSIADAVKIYCSSKEVRKERSQRMKKRYENGDILTKEQRESVVKKGSDAWVAKIKNATQEERVTLLEAFTTAGNQAQQERRHMLTPADYERLYPFAKGKARYYDCNYCGKQMIAWFGGKPRHKKRFCNISCWQDYQVKHPAYGFPNTRMYYSNKMDTEFCLHSKLEELIAKILDESNKIENWSTIPFYIKYNLNGKDRRYYADFLINGKIILEVKSGYFFDLHKDEVLAKIKAAEKYCAEHGLTYMYWQFNDSNLTYEKLINEDRVKQFLYKSGNNGK